MALLGSLAALAAVSIVQTRAAAETAEALERLSEAHDAVHRHTAGVERAAAAHDRFAELVLAGGGVDDITAALAELPGGWVVLLGRGRSPAAAAPARRRRQLPVLDAARRGSRPAGPPRTTCGPSTVKAASRAARVPGDRRGGGLDDPDRRTVERAAVVTALLLLFERAAADAEQRMRTDLVSDLVERPRRRRRTGRRGPAARASTSTKPHVGPGRARPPRRPRRALVMSAHAAVGRALGAVSTTATWSPSCLRATRSMRRRVAARMSRSAEVTRGRRRARDVGRGRPSRRTPTRRRTAAALLALGRAGTGGSASALGLRRAWSSGLSPDVRRLRGARRSARVLDYDRTRGTDLLGTLEAYYAAGGSPRHAATRLHVHVNTVAQRLERVGLLLGTDWQRPEQSLELQLALRLRRLMPD